MANNKLAPTIGTFGQVLIPVITTIILMFGAIITFGDRFITQKEHLEFRQEITAEVRRNEGILSGKLDRTDFDIWKTERNIFLEDALRQLHDKLTREEFDRWLTERKHQEDLSALNNPLATKAYVDSQDQKSMSGIETANRRIDKILELYRDLNSHHLRLLRPSTDSGPP